MFTVAEYQKECLENWTFGGTLHNTRTGLYHLQWKLLGEIGEFCEKIGKASRDDGLEWGDTPANLNPDRRAGLLKELGDIAWYVCVLPYEFNVEPMQRIANLERSAGQLLIMHHLDTPPATAMLMCALDLNATANSYLRNMMVYGGDSETLHQQFVAQALVSIAQLAKFLGHDLTTVMETNVAKLKDRRSRDKITGDGDNR